MRKLFFLFVLLWGVNWVGAQIINPGQKAKDKANREANRSIDQAIDKGVDAIGDGINSIFKKKDKDKKKKTDKVSSSNSKGKASSSTSGDDTDFSEYEGSTFVPGKDVLFFDNFSSVHDKNL